MSNLCGVTNFRKISRSDEVTKVARTPAPAVTRRGDRLPYETVLNIADMIANKWSGRSAMKNYLGESTKKDVPGMAAGVIPKTSGANTTKVEFEEKFETFASDIAGLKDLTKLQDKRFTENYRISVVMSTYVIVPNNLSSTSTVAVAGYRVMKMAAVVTAVCKVNDTSKLSRINGTGTEAQCALQSYSLVVLEIQKCFCGRRRKDFGDVMFLKAREATPPPHSSATASTLSAPRNTSTPPSWIHQHRGVHENAPPKKPHRERSDKGQPKMSPKSQKRREAAAAAA
ncbi:hypothetical protein B0H14DRAFT_2572567 [Mycena olivaceomarginata]|nr:hypothetical protein B0H14DRAFT_2572567 [Mycena olivaceomarginata]